MQTYKLLLQTHIDIKLELVLNKGKVINGDFTAKNDLFQATFGCREKRYGYGEIKRLQVSMET